MPASFPPTNSEPAQPAGPSDFPDLFPEPPPRRGRPALVAGVVVAVLAGLVAWQEISSNEAKEAEVQTAITEAEASADLPDSLAVVPVRGPLRSPGPALPVAAVRPASNALAVATDAVLHVRFGREPGAADTAGLRVFSSQYGGRRRLVASGSGKERSFVPVGGAYRPGEVLDVSAPGEPGRVQQLRVAAGAGGGLFGGRNADKGLEVPVGDQPDYLAVADVDGDGDLDLLTANSVSETISLRRNDGHGTFAGDEELPLHANPNGLLVGDVDGDGDLDVLVSPLGSRFVSICLNDGRGHFGPHRTVPMGTEPSTLALADVDADGDLDLLATCWAKAGTVTLRLNDGHGAFGGGQAIAVGHFPSDLALGDVDNDGDLDLLTTNYGGSTETVSLRLNDGRGHFGGGRSLAAGLHPTDLAVGDVDGDGDLDLLVGDGSYRISRQLNDGHGGFRAAPPLRTLASPEDLALGDVDGDGDLDLVVPNAFHSVAARSTSISVWRNDGRGGFGPRSSQEIQMGNNSNTVTLADVDGDGDLDILLTNNVDSAASVWYNEPR